MNDYIPGGVLNPDNYQHILDPTEAKAKLAKAVLSEIPRQVPSPLLLRTTNGLTKKI